MIKAKIENFKQKLRLSNEAKSVIWEIALFVVAFALMPVRFLFGTYPFGIALLSGTKKQAPFVFAGAMLSAIFLMENTPVYAVALIGQLGLRIASSFVKRSDYVKTELGQKQGVSIVQALFCESKELRVAVAALCTLGIGIYKVIVNGYIYYDIFALVFNVVLVSILTFCFCCLFDVENKKHLLIGVGALLFCVAYALSGKEIGGVDIVLFLSYAAVLYVSKSLDGIKSGALGVILGVAQGGVTSGALGICGLVAGFLWGLSPYLAVMCAFVLSMGYAISLMGYEAVVLLMPELLAASLIMYPLLKFEVLPRPKPLQKKEVKGIEAYKIETRSEEIKGKVSRLGTAYKDVAKMLKGLGEKTKIPDKRGYLDIALESCEAHCYSCPKHSICWERDIETTEKNINKMGRALFNNKEVKKEDVDEKFLHRCPNIDTVMEELNAKNKSILLGSVKNDKLEVCAQNYEGVSKTIEAIFKAENNITVDKALTDKAIKVAGACGLACDKLEVFGDVSKEIIATGVDVQRSKCTSEALRQEMEKGLGLSLNEAELFETDGYTTLKLKSKNNFKLEAEYQTYTVGEDGLNGDSFAMFTYGQKQYMVICDGMGSGRDAHLTSELCVELLEKMLSVSEDKGTVLSMLNSLIRAKNTECSSTVDLFELDLISGDGKLVKSGACPSFIKRGDNVFKLQSKTVPIGIMKSLDAEELAFTVSRGDICVMVSDGAVPSKQDTHWLKQYLIDYKGTDPHELSQGIMKEAKRKGLKDDTTVVCAVIK
ncbi:MAG: SpoIIE family protein phosphatase [Clostridia bacterium]|nr:SpoIIE family protein phosphatase [Clostridia bacterium]